MFSLKLCMLAAVLTAGSSDPVLLSFSSPSCQHCTAMAPLVARLKSAGYRVQHINVMQQRSLARKFRVRAVPSFVLLAGGREIDRIEGRTDYARLAGIFRGASDAAPNPTTIRGQSPSAPPGARGPSPAAAYSERPVDVVQQGLDASVRIYVEDPQGRSVGAGTIVDVHGDEALVLTCGHLFRDSQGKGSITIDLFEGGRKKTVEGALLSYNFDPDLALISIRPGPGVRPVQIADPQYRPQKGEPVFTIGCDHGQNPNVLHSRIAAINKYVGPANIEVAGVPADGRSGGGLFAADGRLIGVCNAADAADQEGLYAAYASIHQELDKLGLSELYRRQPNSLQPAEPRRFAANTRLAPTAQMETNDGVSGIPAMPATFDYTHNPANAGRPNRLQTAAVAAPSAFNPSAFTPPTDAASEVVYFVRPGGPTQGNQVLVVRNPSSRLLEQLMREAGASSSSPVAEVARTRPRDSHSHTHGSPVMRGQSKY